MIYHQRDNDRRKRKKWQAIIVFIVLITTFTLFSMFAPQFFSPVMHAVGVPAAQSRNIFTQGFGGFIELFKSKRTLVAQNREMKEKLALHDAIIAERILVTQDNNALKALLGRSEARPEEVVATILSKPGFSPYDTLIIDAGNEEGITSGDLVLADRSVVIGHVDSVLPHSSKVIIYSSPDYKTDIFIGEKAIQTIAVGKGGGNFEVKLPRNAEVKEGDVVMLSQFPSKVFGRITSIETSSSDTFDRVLFRGVVDVNQLRFVTIEKQ